MRHRKPALLVALVCGVALALSGCVSNPSPQEQTVLPKISLTEARTTQNDELARFRQFVSYDIIVKDYGISPPSEAMSCNVLDSQPITPDSGVQLAGSWRALTPAEVDLEPLLEEVRVAYKDKPGWNVTSTKNASATDTIKGLTLTSPENYTYYFDIATEPDRENFKDVSVLSFSPCVETPNDFDIDARY